MRNVFITAPTIIGGVCYDPSQLPQSVPDDIAEHLVSIGNATNFETKVVEVTEKKSVEARDSSFSHQGQVSQEPIAKKRGRKKQK